MGELEGVRGKLKEGRSIRWIILGSIARLTQENPSKGSDTGLFDDQSDVKKGRNGSASGTIVCFQ